jgi:hypothetical protein
VGIGAGWAYPVVPRRPLSLPVARVGSSWPGFRGSFPAWFFVDASRGSWIASASLAKACRCIGFDGPIMSVGEFSRDPSFKHRRHPPAIFHPRPTACICGLRPPPRRAVLAPRPSSKPCTQRGSTSGMDGRTWSKSAARSDAFLTWGSVHLSGRAHAGESCSMRARIG